MRFTRAPRMVVGTAVVAALALSAATAVASSSATPASSTYIRNLTQQDLTAAGSAAPYGKWTLQIKRRGLSLNAKGQGLVPERASWTGAKVIVSDTPGSISIFCGASVKGAYTWRQSGSKLSFRLVKDTCKDRAGVLAGSWKQTG
jgi:hypothetical protein